MNDTSATRTRPARLAPGDTIMLVATSRPPLMEHVETAVEALRCRGYEVIVPEGLAARTGYLAGDDATRAAELTAAFADPRVDAVFPIKGGFGATRMLDQVDYGVIRRNPKVFIGFSDITALHAAIGRRANLVTFHSPNPQWGLGSKDGLHPFAERWFWRAIEGPAPGEAGEGYTIDAREHLHEPREVEAATRTVTLSGGVAEGPIVGGNLALVAALMGTPDEIEMRGRILFIEEVAEAPYRVDRMLQQLESAGKLEGLAGVLAGRFTKAEVDEADGRTVEDVLREYFEGAAYPVVIHFPSGHVEDNATLPLGVPVRLDADARTVTVLVEPTMVR